MRVCITGAAGQIASYFIPVLLSGAVFPGKQITLLLLDLPPCLPKLKGLLLEIQDCAYQALLHAEAHDDPRQAFRDVDLIVFLGGFPRKPGMERKELLSCNRNIFEAQGLAIAELGLTKTKCLVVANPANTNTLILKHFAKTLPAKNFSCLTRLDQNRATAQISQKLAVPVSSLSRVVIWGNHSTTQVPDLTHAVVKGEPVKVDSEWVPQFIERVQKRGAQILGARGVSSVPSAAKAVGDHLASWWDSKGEWVSMGVCSSGLYAPKGLICSVPVVCKQFDYSEVEGLKLSEQVGERLRKSVQQLEEEGKQAGVWPQ